MGVYTSNQTKKGWLTSILELGAWVGTIYSGFLAEIISRKYAILVNVGVFIIGVVVQCTAAAGGGSSSILGGRFITGMGVGSLSMIVPMYNAEVAPPEVRGALVGLQQLAITTGIMISFWIDYGTNYIGGTGETQKDAAWLVPLALQLAPALLLGLGMLMMVSCSSRLHSAVADMFRSRSLLDGSSTTTVRRKRARPLPTSVVSLKTTSLSSSSSSRSRLNLFSRSVPLPSTSLTSLMAPPGPPSSSSSSLLALSSSRSRCSAVSSWPRSPCSSSNGL